MRRKERKAMTNLTYTNSFSQDFNRINRLNHIKNNIRKSNKYDTTQYNAIQYNNIRYNTIKYNTIQYNKVYKYENYLTMKTI